jgi:predicted permease
MENFILAFTVVFPLTAYMALGHCMLRVGYWSSLTVDEVNRVCFSIFLPILLFENIRRIDLSMGIDVKLLIFACASVFLSFIILCLVVPRIEKDNPRRGVMIQGIFRSNFILFGLPVARTIWGQEQLGETTALIAVIVPIFNVLAVLALELFGGETINLRRSLKKISRNPLIIGSLLGIMTLISGIHLPQFIAATCDNLSKVGTPLALMALGGSFRLSGARNCLGPLLISVTAKLLVMPAIWLLAAAVTGFRGLAMISLLPLFAAPVAVSSFTMAQQMNGDAELASQQVVYSSILSIFTMFFWIVLLKGTGMF